MKMPERCHIIPSLSVFLPNRPTNSQYWLQDYPQFPPDYRHTDEYIWLVKVPNLSLSNCLLKHGNLTATHKTDWLGVAVSCGYGTCFAVRSCDELYHFIFSIDRVGIPFGFQTIIWTLARHPVSRCLYFPATGVTWSVWYLPVPTCGSTWVVLWLLFFRSAPSTFPNKRSTLQGPFREVPSR